MSGDELKFVQAAKNNDKQTVKKLNTKLCPKNAKVSQSVIDAIIMADCIILGPGSLYTSDKGPGPVQPG